MPKINNIVEIIPATFEIRVIHHKGKDTYIAEIYNHELNKIVYKTESMFTLEACRIRAFRFFRLYNEFKKEKEEP
jgi:hypothetical protein